MGSEPCIRARFTDIEYLTPGRVAGGIREVRECK
jgi:hypothetical protein